MQNPLPVQTERLHGLDALRGIALLLGLLVHASMSFLPGAQYFWLSHDSRPEAWLGLAFYVPHMFRMMLFFLLAGFFARLALQRLGTAAFIRDRARRIGLPLLAGWPLVMTAIVIVLVWGATLATGSLPREQPPGPAFTPDDFPLTHLWFLYVLLLCYASSLLLRGLCALLDRRGRIAGLLDRALPMLMGWHAPLLLALPLACALAAQGKWYAWFGIPTPDQSLYPNLPAIIAFGSAYALGWWLHRRQDLLQALAGRWPWHLGLAIVATLACLSMLGLEPLLVSAASGAETLAYATIYAIGAWSWCFALVGLCLRFLSGYSAARRYLADASYWIYLAHLPLVMALQVAATRFEWPAMLEFALVVAIALVLLLASYHWLVRGSFIGKVLNGPSRRPATSPVALTHVGLFRAKADTSDEQCSSGASH